MDNVRYRELEQVLQEERRTMQHMESTIQEFQRKEDHLQTEVERYRLRVESKSFVCPHISFFLTKWLIICCVGL